MFQGAIPVCLEIEHLTTGCTMVVDELIALLLSVDTKALGDFCMYVAIQNKYEKKFNSQRPKRCKNQRVTQTKQVRTQTIADRPAKI